MTPDKQPDIRIHLFPRVERAAHFIRHCLDFLPECAPDYMANHHFEHPLDVPVKPVTSMPTQPEYESAGSYWFKKPTS